MVRRMCWMAALVVAAAGMPAMGWAQAGNPNDPWCRNSGSSDRAQYCEVREMTMVPPGGVLTVNAKPNGSIAITGWDSRDVRIRAKVTAQADSEEQAQALALGVRVNAGGDAIGAGGPKPADGQSWAVSYEVSVPFDQPLSLVSVNGSLRLTGIRAAVGFETVNGSVTVEKAGGKIEGRTQNGSIKLALDGERWMGEGLDLKTQNGSIAVSAPERFAAHLEASTVNGRVGVDLPMTVSEQSRRHLVADLNGGGTPVRLETMNGSIVVSKQ
ncbi:MAG: DUF4097 family beta strand repeat-containing protein [Bacteroidales bacterium]